MFLGIEANGKMLYYMFILVNFNYFGWMVRDDEMFISLTIFLF